MLKTVTFKNVMIKLYFQSSFVDLLSVIQREVPQKEENKCRMLTHLCGMWRNSMGEPWFAGQKWRYRCGDWTRGWDGGREGGGNWEIGTHIYTVCKRDSQRGAAAEHRSSARALGGLEGGCGWRGAHEEEDGRVHIADSHECAAETNAHCQAIGLQLKHTIPLTDQRMMTLTCQLPQTSQLERYRTKPSSFIVFPKKSQVLFHFKNVIAKHHDEIGRDELLK